jgi:uncharacterized protein YutE (UPF0331/DUF86 family)
MTDKIASNRCTSKDALAFCNHLIQNYDKLDNKLVEEIASETINRTVTTVEDVLRHATRSF